LSGDRSAATVAGRPIRLSDVERRASRLRNDPAVRRLGPADDAADDWITRWAVRHLVGEAVLDYEIRGATEPAPADRPEEAVRRLIRRVTAHVAISEQEVRAYYERNAELYRCSERRRVHYVAVERRRDAVGAARRLMAGGVGITGVEGYSEMELRRGEYVGDFEAAVFAARIGEVVGPIRTEHGWLVARVDEIAPEATVPYEVARPAIAHELLELASVRAFDDWLERRRLELARIVPAFEHPAHPVHGYPRHRH
jgi:PPIC-type PPIASE domain